MGVHGLWRLIEPSGKPVPLETLENKVLAVDVSIWLHQAIKGFQDSKGAPLPNAHLLGIYHRVCKLLYFRVKPVFVFDGGVPVLKKQTIAKRNQQKSKNLSEADRIQKQLLSTLLQHTAIANVLSEKTKAAIALPPKKQTKTVQNDMYMLPPAAEFDSTLSSSDEETDFPTSTSETTDSSPTKNWDLHTIDTTSVHFKTLPVDVRHEILTDLKETRKQSSWGRLHELPKQSDDFSVFQMKRLLKRQAVQAALEQAQTEMGGHSLSLGELESLLTDQGVITANNSVGSRIASDENTRFLLIKDVKSAMDKARKEQEALETIPELPEESSNPAPKNNKELETAIEHLMQKSEDDKIEEKLTRKNAADVEYEENLKLAIALSLQEEPSTSSQSSQTDNGTSKLQFSFLDSADFHSDSSEELEETAVGNRRKVLSSAQNYMMEYSGLTPAEIAKIIGSNAGTLPKNQNYKAKNVINSTKNLKKIGNTRAGIKDNVTEDVEIMSSSEESDDFLEVPEEVEEIEDKPIKELEIPLKNNATTLEIVIQPIEEPEDDLFSDIFGSNIKDPEENMRTTTAVKKQVQFSEKLEEIKIFEEKDKPLEKMVEEISEIRTETIENEVAANHVAEEKLPMEEISNATKLLPEKSLEQPTPKSIKEPPKPKLTVDQMKELQSDLRKEQMTLLAEKSSKERLAGNITDQMYQEAQELLEMFGVPYIIAPMEAEAQCAFLDEINLTDGTITDDSDIWLFGGKTVYKNFFNQAKHVMEFRAENIQHHFKLTREQMILLALLVGSDYTTGIQGVGPVTALEILAAFPPSKTQEFKLSQPQLISGLADFRIWFNKEKTPGAGRTALKNKLKNVTFTENFPSIQVVQAYLDPKVETNKDKFSWGKPDVVALIDFAKEKFGWTRKKTEEIINPVVAKMEEKRMQKSIKDFFKTNFKFDGGDAESKMSKRVRSAISKIGKDPEELEEELSNSKPKRTRKKKSEVIASEDKINSLEELKTQPKTTRKKKSKENTSEDVFPKDLLEADEDVKLLKQVKSRSRKRVEEISKEVKSELDKEVKKKKLPNFHKKELIPQKERDKTVLLKSKMKAIELFRKSKKGPGFVPKRDQVKKLPKENAELSDSSSDE